ncbi:hypothetical protein DERF_015891 [Dermatophagoides farinae]|uniref:Uncharacterized protein n=1 Tax=Dermatophagoides farinae TaxID=6954 RepID=A0A922HKN9_DERFA|nr:hypothetical protein DERF_015891 [Dermatophagoides farinae]
MDFKPPSSVIFHTANGRKIEVTDGQMAKVRSILWRKNDSDSNMKHITVNTDNRTRMKTSKYFSNTNTNFFFHNKDDEFKCRIKRYDENGSIDNELAADCIVCINMGKCFCSLINECFKSSSSSSPSPSSILLNIVPIN